VQVRSARGASFAVTEGLGVFVRDIYNLFPAATYSDFAWISAEVALTDSDVFSPAAIPLNLVGNVLNPTTFSAVARIKGLTFSGKAPGSRAKFTLFGIGLVTEAAGTIGGDGVITGVELAAITTAAGIATTHFRANSGDAAIFPLRATYKGNDLLLRRVRKGTIT